jgi:hypothetical protein
MGATFHLKTNGMSTTIEKGRSVLTLINVFSVEPGKQQELVTPLIKAAEQTMKWANVYQPNPVGSYPVSDNRFYRTRCYRARVSREMEPVSNSSGATARTCLHPAVSRD